MGDDSMQEIIDEIKEIKFNMFTCSAWYHCPSCKLEKHGENFRELNNGARALNCLSCELKSVIFNIGRDKAINKTT